MENSISKICEILNVKIDQTFKIQFFKHKNPYKHCWYKITELGLMYSYGKDGKVCSKSQALEGLILGKHKIIFE